MRVSVREGGELTRSATDASDGVHVLPPVHEEAGLNELVRLGEVHPYMQIALVCRGGGGGPGSAATGCPPYPHTGSPGTA